MRTIIAVLLGLGISSCGTSRVLTDQTIPHRVVEGQTLAIWARRPDKSMGQVRVTVAGEWWLVGPAALVGSAP